VLEVSEDEDEDSSIDNEYKSLHPELVGWDSGVSSIACVRDPFREQQELITFN
jgi:hypothetical protein